MPSQDPPDEDRAAPDRPGRHRQRRLTHLLAATALGVYVLVVAGAATGLLDGGSACGTWPTCDGAWLPPRTDPTLLAAWSHRAATVLVGGLLAATTWRTWRQPAPRRIRTATTVAAALYPGQIWLGALTATGGPTTGLASAHLVAGVAIVSGCLLALVWQLEHETDAVPTTPGARDRDGSTGGEDTHEPTDAPAAQPSGGAPPAEAEPATPDGTTARVRHRAAAYVRLTKPKLWWLLCLVALAAMGLAGGRSLDPGTVVATLAGGVLAIGASGTFNNVLERDVDRHMDRTADRPVVEGAIPPRRAVAFGLALLVASVGVFLAFVNPLAAGLGVLAVLFYTVVYTVVLKPHTDQNVVVGGAVGAFPALIGWAAVTGTVGVPAVVLGAVVFLWTPAHFYNLAMAYREDYARAGIPMLPVVRGAATTRRHVALYFGATMVAAVGLGTATRLGWVYGVVVVLVAVVFLRELVAQYRAPSDRTAMRTFHASNTYLGAVLVAVLVDAMVL